MPMQNWVVRWQFVDFERCFIVVWVCVEEVLCVAYHYYLKYMELKA